MKQAVDRKEIAELIRRIVGEDGQLAEDYKFLSREVIYRGRNGKAVERIAVPYDKGTLSLIFKPLTFNESIGREIWAVENLLPALPAIRYPALLGVSDDRDPERYWMVYEDLGKLEHKFDAETYVEAARLAPHWHMLPLAAVPMDFEGHTPKVEHIQGILLEARDELPQVLGELGLRQSHAAYIDDVVLRIDPAELHGETVVCHGDFNPLNIARSGGELTILDWEYAHRNSVYWDLYNLLDITSPAYRRPVADRLARTAVLDAYAHQRSQLGRPVADGFALGYHRYCLVYCVWLLLLIGRDLEHGRFDRSSLLQQRDETAAILKEAVDYCCVNQ
jgi:hypothetical protein